jgi:hypothetical protein
VVHDLMPPKRLGRVAQIARVVALGLLLVAAPLLEARADQAAAMTRALPMSTATAEAPAQCCRMCQKGQPCGSPARVLILFFVCWVRCRAPPRGARSLVVSIQMTSNFLANMPSSGH